MRSFMRALPLTYNQKKCYDSRANLRWFHKTKRLTYYMFVLVVREDGSKKEQCARLIRKFVFMRKLAFLSFPIRYWKALKMVIKIRLLWDEKKTDRVWEIQILRWNWTRITAADKAQNAQAIKLRIKIFAVLFSFHFSMHGMCRNCDGVKRKACIDLTINGFCFCAKVHICHFCSHVTT